MKKEIAKLTPEQLGVVEEKITHSEQELYRFLISSPQQKLKYCGGGTYGDYIRCILYDTVNETLKTVCK